MMTRKGLAKMPPGCGDYPQLVSHEIIPDSLKTVDGISRLAYLAFDVLNEVVHIHVSGDVAEYWLFDVKYGGFWPVTSPGTSILAMHRHDPLESDTQSGVLIGTAEGLMRLDSDVAIGGVDKAYVQLGPSRNDQSLGEQAILQKSVLKFADTTDDLDADVKFYAAENCETVCDEPGNKRYATKLKNFANGHAVHPRVAGQANLTVITQGDTSKHFAFEEESDYLVAAGRERGAT